MSMNVGSSGGAGADPEPMMEMNMTPLIDVMLVLLIIFMVTAPLLTARLPLDLPKANAPLAATPPAISRVDTPRSVAARTAFAVSTSATASRSLARA